MYGIEGISIKVKSRVEGFKCNLTVLSLYIFICRSFKPYRYFRRHMLTCTMVICWYEAT